MLEQMDGSEQPGRLPGRASAANTPDRIGSFRFHRSMGGTHNGPLMIRTARLEGSIPPTGQFFRSLLEKPEVDIAKSPALDQLLVVDPRDDAIALLTAGLVSIWA